MLLSERRLEIGAGLGDCLATLPACYALAAEGQRVEVACLQPGGGELHRTDHLPTLRLFGEGRVSPEASRLEFWSRTDWGSNRSMFDQVASILGTVIRDTPRTALLQQLPEHREVARRLVGHGPYVVICPEGSWHGSGDKLFSQDQVRGVVRGCRGRALPVLCHTSPLHYRDTEALDLCGKTTLPEFVALVACAEAVVSTDTGAAHLAGAFQKPLLAATGPSINPYCVAGDYQPCLWLKAARHVENNDPVLLRRWTQAILDVAAARVAVVVPDRWPCGVVDTGRRLAQATGADLLTLDDDPSEYDAVIAQYHPVDARHWTTWLQRWGDQVAVVWDVHKPTFLAPEWPGEAIVHWTHYVGHVPGHRTRFIPLPTWQVPEEWQGAQARPKSRLAWHGMVRAHKGLLQLVQTFRQVREEVAEAELVLCGTVGARICDRDLAAKLEALRVPGLRVDLREQWEEADLLGTLREADVYCYLDTPEQDREQSGCSAAALGFGRPVVVSESSCHDDLRRWCTTAEAGNEAEALVRLLTDAEAYAAATERAQWGAEFRSPALVGRQVKAMAQQAMLNRMIQRGQ
jgi:glycosyltransferase involved in cell wall biosynthesis